MDNFAQNLDLNRVDWGPAVYWLKLTPTPYLGLARSRGPDLPCGVRRNEDIDKIANRLLGFFGNAGV
jgi:hypothetical protein